MSALLKIKSLRAATAETLRLSFGFVRRIHFDCSKSPDKISQLEPQPNTLVECDGSSSSKLQGGGTGVMVTSFNSAFMDFNRAFHPNVQQQYKTTNCSGIMEYIALQNGLNFALELLRERKILSPIVVQTDLESLLPNVEKLSLNLPHNIGNRTIGLCTNICNLLDYMPPDTHLVWNSGSKGNASHYLAKSILIGGQDQNRENRLLWDFYNLHFSFEPQKISQVVQWALALCKSYQIYPGSPVLEIGCGNGMLLQELNKQRFSEDLLGIDSSKGIIGYACHLAKEYGHHNIRFLVDDVLHTRLNRRFPLVLDNGTLDAIRLHPSDRLMYWESAARLVAPGGLLVVTSHLTCHELLGMIGPFAFVEASQLEKGTIVAWRLLEYDYM